MTIPLLWAAACSDDDTTAAPDKDGGATGGKKGTGGEGSGGDDGAGGGPGGGTGGGAPTGCDLQPCAGQVVQGITIPACCLTEDTCGVGFPGLCLPLSSIGGIADAAPVLPPETIVLDPSCEDQIVNMTVYKGCCDPSGFCGAAVDVPGLVQCLTPDDVRGLNQPITTPSVPCGSRDSGVPDAAPTVPDSGRDGSVTDAGQPPTPPQKDAAHD